MKPVLEWYQVDRENRKDGKMWRAQIDLWARLEVWPTEAPSEWAWKVGTGGTQGMAVVSVAASPEEGKVAAEKYLRDLLGRALRQLSEQQS